MQESAEGLVDRSSDENCSRERAYVAIIITILPLWAIVTTLVVFILLAFHKSLRATIIYDNCNKSNAQYAYYIQIRTGDTSATFNRRKTTITIDMFDDNQVTLARVAVPGHLIFGRKETPTGMIEDEKYFELRVTRFWLYRATRLKKVSTIRLTHNCLEQDARIMIYGVEIRSNDRDRAKLFFPVLSYISAFGSTKQPNACFDLENQGSISAMGGSRQESSVISEQLSWVDLIILCYLLGAMIFYASSKDMIRDSNFETNSAIIRGLLVGSVSYLIILIFGIVIRIIFKHYYSLSIGTGLWAYTYYSIMTFLTCFASGFWIYVIIYSYKNLCPEYYNMWLLSVVLAMFTVIFLGTLTAIVNWVINIINPPHSEQYALPEESGSYQENSSKSSPYVKSQPQYQMKQLIQHQPSYPPIIGSQAQTWHPHIQPAPQQTLPMQVMMQPSPQPIQYQPGPVQATMYGQQQPLMVGSVVSPALYKPAGTYNPTPTLATFETSQSHPMAPVNPTQPSAGPPQTIQTQGGGITRAPKKIGSNESTGSTYYHQLMKNKGGVKSISQYGELLKHKKAKHPAK